MKIKIHKNKLKKWLYISGTLFLFFVLTRCVVYAAETDWYINNEKILSQHDFIEDALRKVGWWVLTAVVNLCNGCQWMYDKAFGFIDVTTITTVDEFIEKFKPAVIAFMALSLLYLGFMLMFEHEKKPKIMINICIAILCVTSSALVFQTLNSWTIKLKDAVNSGNPKNVAYEVVNDNITDLLFLNYEYKGLDNVDWKHDPSWGINLSSASDYSAINFTEVLNYKSSYSWEGKTKDFLSHCIYYDNKTPKIKEVENGFGWNSKDDADIGNTFYYRYTFRFLEAFLQLGALIIIYITMSYKVVRVAFELVVARLFAYLYSAELSGGEKIKKILVFIRDSYILLVVTAISIRVYMLLSDWLRGAAEKNNWSSLIVAIFSLFLAFAVIDGPNLVEKLLGMDAGLKSSTARMLAIGRAASGFGRAAGGVAAGMSAKNIAQKVGNVKSGDMAKGGLGAGAVGAVFGKEVSNSDPGTHREGGLLNRIKGNSGTPGSSGSGGSQGFNASSGGQASAGSSSGSQGAAGSQGREGRAEKGERGESGQKGDKGDRGDMGFKGFEGKEGKAGEQGKEGSNPFEAKKESSSDRRSFMDQGTRTSSGSSYSSSHSNSQTNGNNFMNGGGNNGNKNNDSKYRK